MAAADPIAKESASVALPGLARALISAGKLQAKTAEEIYQKSRTARTSFIAELTGTGAVSAADLAHTLSGAFGAPLLDLDAIDPQRLPKDLLDAKLCQSYRIVVLGKRNNRLIVATADPSDQQAVEKIKFASQMGVAGGGGDWSLRIARTLLRRPCAGSLAVRPCGWARSRWPAATLPSFRRTRRSC